MKQGQLLAVIDNPEVIEDADRAAAALSQAKAAVAQAEARIKTSEADLKAAQAMVKKAEADIERYTSTRRYREKELARYRGLLAQQAVPQQIVDEEEEHYESAIAAEHSAEAEVFTVQGQGRLGGGDGRTGQGRPGRGQGERRRSPSRTWPGPRSSSSTPGSSHPTPASSPSAASTAATSSVRPRGGGEKPILTVARTDKVRVVTYVPDRDVPYTDVGDKAKLTLDALPGEVFEGTVTRFAETEDPQSRTMRTEVDLPNPKDRLREGMYGNLTIILDESTQNLTIPTACLAAKSGQGRLRSSSSATAGCMRRR